MTHHIPTTPGAHADQNLTTVGCAFEADRILARTIRGVWPSLPALSLASATTCIATAIPLLAVPGVNPGSLLIAAVVVAPFVGALAATVDTIASDGEASIRDWRHGLAKLWLFAIRQALVPAAVGSLFLAALEVWTRHHNRWIIPSLALTGGTALLASIGLLAVLPLGAARTNLRGTRLWITGIYLITRRPARFGAALAVIFIGLWAATAWSAALLLLVPAPATIVLVVALRTSIADTGHLDAATSTD